MLPIQHRITRGDDFRRIMRTGRKTRTDLGVISVAASRDGVFRLGVIVSKAVGGAVVRNRVKRLVRAALWEQRNEATGLEIVVRATPEANTQSFDDISSSISRAIGAARVSS